MKYLAMKSNDIRQNLATEEYLMNSDEIPLPFMLFYIEKPCIIVGRNQNTLEEINQQYCEEHHITVTRRLSGGGAMYQDLGNLCFSFVVPAKDQRFGDFKHLVAPVVNTLHQMGATGAAVTGRNDIVIDGRKFSGNAMYSRNQKTFSHGTMMYNVDTDAVAGALHVAHDKIASKGIKSVRSRVTNIRQYLAPEFQHLTTAEFRDELIKRIWHVSSIEEARQNEYQLTADDQRAIEQLVKQRYANWDWVYGKSPEFTVKKRHHFDSGTIDARYQVENGKIVAVHLYGDFFGTGDVNEIAQALVGIPYTPAEISKVLRQFDLQRYFLGIPDEQIINLLAEQH